MHQSSDQVNDVDFSSQSFVKSFHKCLVGSLLSRTSILNELQNAITVKRHFSVSCS